MHGQNYSYDTKVLPLKLPDTIELYFYGNLSVIMKDFFFCSKVILISLFPGTDFCPSTAFGSWIIDAACKTICLEKFYYNRLGLNSIRPKTP